MWIEFNIKGERGLINSRGISLISTDGSTLSLVMSNSYLTIECDDNDDAIAIIQGFNLALNGHDFVYSESEFIRPIVQCKQEAIYEYMKRQEFLGDRR